MIRRLTIAAALAGALTMGGATAAAAAIGTTTSSRGACVAVRAIDAGYCVTNPAPDLPKLKVPSLPDPL